MKHPSHMSMEFLLMMYSPSNAADIYRYMTTGRTPEDRPTPWEKFKRALLIRGIERYKHRAAHGPATQSPIGDLT